MMRSLWKFLVSEDGPTAVEYVFMLSLIIVICIAGIAVVGSNTHANFEKFNSGLS